MRKFFGSMGSVTRVIIESQALKSNMLGDPSVRVVDVYVPAGHDGQGLPLLVDLVGTSRSAAGLALAARSAPLLAQRRSQRTQLAAQFVDRGQNRLAGASGVTRSSEMPKPVTC